MKLTGVLMVVAVIAVVVSGINLINNVALSQTGRASTTPGNVTLEIQSIIDINFTNNIINWSSGYVDSDGTPTECTSISEAQLATNTVNGSAGNSLASNPSGIKCGVGWIPRLQGLTLQSDSNQDILVNITSNQNAFNLIDNGVALTPPSEFQWMVQENETGSCEAGATTGRLYPTNYTNVVQGVAITICNDFDWGPTTDALDIDFLVNISPQATVVGYRTAVMTATAERSATQ